MSAEAPILEKKKLIAQYSFLLHSDSAQKIVRGSAKHGPVGLFQFIARLKKLLKAMAEDDPYAEDTLLKIYEMARKTNNFIDEAYLRYQTILEEIEGLIITHFRSTMPEKYEINTTFKYVALITDLIHAYDKLVCLILTGTRLLKFDEREAKNDMYKARHFIRSVMSLPFRWQYTGVTRYDIQHETQKAKRAAEMIGFKLNDAVLSGVIHAPFQ